MRRELKEYAWDPGALKLPPPFLVPGIQPIGHLPGQEAPLGPEL